MVARRDGEQDWDKIGHLSVYPCLEEEEEVSVTDAKSRRGKCG
jgi:hypothetical protein